VNEVIREVFLGEAYIPALGRSGNLDWVIAEETAITYEGALVGTYVQCYADMITKKMAGGTIVYAPVRKGFVAKAGAPWKAEFYADIAELKSLCNIIGPYGFKLIDREILKFILQAVNSLKDNVSHNTGCLQELARGYQNEAAATEALRKFKEGGNFVAKAVSIGSALCFRELMQEALRQTVLEKAPLIYNTVNGGFNQYRRNTFMAPELLPTDCLAHDCGIPVGTSDQALKKFLAKAIGSADAPLWDLLPYMFAASFTSSNIWREAVYKPGIDGYLNNAHTLARAIFDLIVAFKAITTSTNDEKDIVVLLKAFVDVSSALLLRMARSASKADKNAPMDMGSLLIFLDKFVDAASPLLTRDVLETSMPYSLLRNQWKTLFTTPKTVAKKQEAAPDVF